MNTVPFNTKRTINRLSDIQANTKIWSLYPDSKDYTWTNSMERVGIIRKGVPYSSIEILSQELNLPIKSFLTIIGFPLNIYKRKKNDDSLLDSRNSELVILIKELIEYGKEVFNNEDKKFQNWLRKSNPSLGGLSPESLLDTVTGIDEVRFCLDRIEYGNMS